MHILLIGLNHKSAPVEIRECLAFSPEDVGQVLPNVTGMPDIKEAMLISTCNRVEFLVVTENASGSAREIKSFLADFRNTPLHEFEKSLYVREDDDAVRHVFRVASSLDSMVLGEPQILGQIKTAHRLSTELETSGVILNRLLHKAFSVAKRVRTETGIADHAVSISYAAVELAKKIFDDLEGKGVLLIGAGEMAVLALEHLVKNGVKRIFVANRTFERAVEVAERFKGTPILFKEIGDGLLDVDIVISSTGASSYILTYKDVKPLVRRRRNRPLFFIDIAVPRDIDPDINRANNVYVYDIDDLKGVIDKNIEKRETEATKGDRIVDEGVIQFGKWLEAQEVTPTIVALRNKAESIRKKELAKTLSGTKSISEKERADIDRLTISICNKILHDPTIFLKRPGRWDKRDLYVNATRKLFNLDENGSANENGQD
ncbi:MAG: glutamyl-tRNA reductase [Deltaproteobacteria bacterium]|jgi:glutamyl-tRNA reductase|nr:glutamyl-tRNA reductase [Deltaproteobacteria bacterium]